MKHVILERGKFENENITLSSSQSSTRLKIKHFCKKLRNILMSNPIFLQIKLLKKSISKII